MKNVVLFFTLVVGVATISTLVTRHLLDRPPPAPLSLHSWLHDQLDLTDEQSGVLQEMDARFNLNEQPLRIAFNAANRALAEVIRHDGAYTPRVAAAIEHVHHQMGELQKLSIAHLFEMASVLDPEQKEKLLDYAELALTETP